MSSESDRVLIKTPQGVNATRSGVGLSPKAYSMLKLFDGTLSVAGFKTICAGASMAEGDFQVALKELLQFDYLRLVDRSVKATEQTTPVSADNERRMLLTLDFTATGDFPRMKSTAADAVADPKNASQTQPIKTMAAVTAAAPADAARDDKMVRLKRESEARQKLMTTLQPRIEEELRTRLRPKLEQELRPKLIAALRPGLEAEVRTALAKELTPRIELELKARFAKTMAAQRATEPVDMPPQSAVVVPAAPVAVVDDSALRLLACMSTPLFTLDKTCVCTYMSPAWSQLSGYAADDAIGKPLVDFFDSGCRRAITAMLTGIANNSALRFEQQGALVRKESAPLWVEISAAPLTAPDGQTIGVCGALRDATELRRIVDQAEADGVRLLLLVEQIDTGVILEDAQGNIQQANPALCSLLLLEMAPYSLEGMEVTALMERAAASFIGPDGFLRRVAEMRAAGEDARGESFVMADGRVTGLDYLAVTTGTSTVGHVWLFRELQRPQSRMVS